MNRYLPIRQVYAREVLDSRGNPTVETEVTVGEGIVGKDGYTGKSIVPSGASTGKYEALELRDKENRYCGQGVLKAVENVNDKLAECILGENVLNQRHIDTLLKREDGTENKEKMGANAILGVSLAAADAAAKALRIPLYQYLGGCQAHCMPVPMMNILNGGKHADNTVDFQEFMIMPVGACCFREGLRMCAEVYHKLKEILKSEGLSAAVGDEGGFAPDLKGAEDALEYMIRAVKEAGFIPGKEISFALDVAASELYEDGKYYFPGQSFMQGERVVKSAEEMIDYYEQLLEKFPIVSIEDGLCEEDWEGWVQMTQRLGNKVQLVGDDLFVTNTKRLQKGIEMGAGNAILIKVNQIGSLSEAMEAVDMAYKAGYRAIISHRSGESEDTFIADLAVAMGTGQIKTGAPCRAERTAKYNRLLKIEDDLGKEAQYRNPFMKNNS